MASPYRPVLFFFERPESVLAGSFAGLILLGAVLLALPVSHAAQPIGFIDALFTSTSAVCVTGLITVDTGTAYSRFGQTVIILLIQLGGLGIMTFAALGLQLLGGKLSFRSQAMIADTFWQGDAATAVRRDLKNIVAMTVIVESVGMLLLYLRLRSVPGPHPPLFSAAFHSVSAFCNAGFSLYSDNLISLRASPLVMFVIMGLLVVGGLGHNVVLEVGRRALCRLTRKKDGPVNWTLHSRVVLTTSVILIFGGAAAILLLGLGDRGDNFPQRVMNALFQSISARTAGYNTVDLAFTPTASLLILIMLMFIGGSPGSCAGGIKTTSAAVSFAEVRARLIGSQDVNLFGRRISHDVVAKATLVVGLAVGWNLFGCMFLTLSELPVQGMHLEHLMFEQISAFGTVGLSTGITPRLSAAGKLWIILTMFIGRVGPLTAALAVLPRGPAGIRYPEERVMIG